MQNSPITSALSSFFMGVATTLVVGVAVRHVVRDKDSAEKEDGLSSPSASSASRDENGSIRGNTREMQTTDLLDSPDLDLRLIRKAEGVIQMRSANLTVVIERSTNSWNHSACLRTAEALVSSRGRGMR